MKPYSLFAISLFAIALPALLSISGLAENTGVDAPESGNLDWISAVAAEPPRMRSGVNESQLRMHREELTRAVAIPVHGDRLDDLLDQTKRLDRGIAAELERVRESIRIAGQNAADQQQRVQMADDRRQQSLLWLSRVEMAVLQSELFASETADAQASAARAARLAESALASLPAGGQVRREVLRLLAEAQLRQGQPDKAQATLAEVVAGDQAVPKRDNAIRSDADANQSDAVSETVSVRPDWRALAVRIAVTRRDWRGARQMLDVFYGDQPESAPRSAAMDLARLKYLLALGDSLPGQKKGQSATVVGDWLDAIGRRNGPLTRSRGETIVARFRERMTQQAATDSSVAASDDPRLQIADGLYLYRTGRPLPAAMTLAKVAMKDQDAERAGRSAIQAAAILAAQQRSAAGAELLVQTAAKIADHPVAPALALQAAGLVTANESTSSSRRPDTDGPTAADRNSTSRPGGPDRTDILRQILTHWPTSEAARSAREWLIRDLLAQQKFLAAAELASSLPAVHWDAASLQRGEIAWQLAVGSPASELPWNDFGQSRWRDELPEPNLDRFLDSLDGSVDEANVVAFEKLRTKIASWLSDESSQKGTTVSFTNDTARLAARCLVLLAGPEEQLWDTAVARLDDPFLQQFAAFRNGRLTAAGLLASPAPEGRLIPATWRLQRDVATQPHRRQAIARVLLTWRENASRESATSTAASAVASQSELAVLRWLVWEGRLDEATRRLDSIDDPRSIGLATIASALSDSPESADQTRAAGFWEQVADGLPQASSRWLRVKTLALEAAFRGLHREQATAAARYLLLTQSPKDPAIRQRLEGLLR